MSSILVNILQNIFEIGLEKSSTSSFRSFLSGSFINSIFLESTTEHEISEICANFRPGTSAGFDQVTIDVVKQTINLIIAPLTHMNLSLSSGLVAEQMKVARVIPLFKSGTLALFTNYRPVSVLPAFSKFLERIVYKRLDSFLVNKYKILSCNPYGFRRNHSTACALIQLNDKLSNAIDHR